MDVQTSRIKGGIEIIITLTIEDAALKERVAEANEGRDREDRVKLAEVREHLLDGSELADLFDNIGLNEEELIGSVIEGL